MILYGVAGHQARFDDLEPRSARRARHPRGSRSPRWRGTVADGRPLGDAWAHTAVGLPRQHNRRAIRAQQPGQPDGDIEGERMLWITGVGLRAHGVAGLLLGDHVHQLVDDGRMGRVPAIMTGIQDDHVTGERQPARRGGRFRGRRDRCAGCAGCAGRAGCAGCAGRGQGRHNPARPRCHPVGSARLAVRAPSGSDQRARQRRCREHAPNRPGARGSTRSPGRSAAATASHQRCPARRMLSPGSSSSSSNRITRTWPIRTPGADTAVTDRKCAADERLPRAAGSPGRLAAALR